MEEKARIIYSYHRWLRARMGWREFKSFHAVLRRFWNCDGENFWSLLYPCWHSFNLTFLDFFSLLWMEERESQGEHVFQEQNRVIGFEIRMRRNLEREGEKWAFWWWERGIKWIGWVVDGVVSHTPTAPLSHESRDFVTELFKSFTIRPVTDGNTEGESIGPQNEGNFIAIMIKWTDWRHSNV